MIKKVFKRIKEWFTKDFNFKKTLICCGISFLAFLLVFPAGSLSSKTVNEVCADYYAKISKEYTVERGDKKLSGLVVEPKDGTTAKVRQDTENAITELWGVFKGSNASFAPVINANKNYDIRFSDKYKAYSDENLSLVYTNSGQSTEVYHCTRDENGEIKDVYDYKFQSSPLALMFASGVSGIQDKLHIYISQTQAEKMLSSRNEEITKENLEKLQWENAQILINGVVCDCIIDNIYLDNYEHVVEQPRNPKTNEKYDYYYASDIGTIAGDFVFVIFTHLKSGVFPEDVKKESLYVMSEYSYRNKFYLEYAKENYSSEDFSFDYMRSNLKEGFDPDDSILQNTLKASKSDVWCTLITILFISAFLAGIFFIYRYTLFKQPLSLLAISCASLIPYFVFKLIFILSNNTYVFSSYSLTFNLILFVAFALAILILNCFGRKLKTEATK